jgi:hypothetical protein
LLNNPVLSLPFPKKPTKRKDWTTGWIFVNDNQRRFLVFRPYWVCQTVFFDSEGDRIWCCGLGFWFTEVGGLFSGPLFAICVVGVGDGDAEAFGGEGVLNASAEEERPREVEGDMGGA